ncbi:hypothetical protein GCM10022403_062840 [Streptomyces coacervatus]|uniref:Uncharacterized protein n=1 Tax=Streptomyces coacervatus TaxID=647381 RepID=A0ABP7IKL5_9ACTN
MLPPSDALDAAQSVAQPVLAGHLCRLIEDGQPIIPGRRVGFMELGISRLPGVALGPGLGFHGVRAGLSGPTLVMYGEEPSGSQGPLSAPGAASGVPHS